ncbi:MAG: hypothetical protein V8S92_01590 [Oscillospiraceae bacterium]
MQDTDRNPSVITITVEKLARREIEVQGDFTGVEVADGYLLESTSFELRHRDGGRARVRDIDNLRRADRHEPDECG